jgi:hypothetical protein
VPELPDVVPELEPDEDVPEVPELEALLVASSCLPPHAVIAVAVAKMSAARVIVDRSMGATTGADPMSAAPQNGHALSCPRTWRAHELQGRRLMIFS